MRKRTIASITRLDQIAARLCWEVMGPFSHPLARLQALVPLKSSSVASTLCLGR